MPGIVDRLFAAKGSRMFAGGDPVLASPEYIAHLATDPRTAGYPTTPMAALAAQLVWPPA